MHSIVKVGVREEAKVQILEGVVPGDRVVTVGGLGLEDGAKVRPEKTAIHNGISN